MSAEREIRAGGLVLEPQTRRHADAMFVLLVDPALYEFEGEPPPSREWLQARFERLESRRSTDGRERWLNWAVRRDDDGALVGYVQATVLEGGDALVAYVLGRRYWGRGYASVAVEAMIGELAREHGVRTLWAVFKARNARSRRLLERLGFAPAEPLREVAGAVEPDEAVMSRAARRA